ncbi:MAG TPA: sec-independent translocase [Actinomycetes bacterium]|nr:sec-independent translocase [Actinomycetes bacterium]
MLDIGAGEFLALGVVAVIVLGPERLPRYAAEAARVVRKVRRLADDARAEVSKELGPEFGDVSLRDLNPRTMVRKHLLDPIDIDSLDDDGPRRSTRPRGSAPSGNPASNGDGAGAPDADPPRYDPDAT